MHLLTGCVVVIGCVLGGYTAMNGKLGVPWQPFEAVIIVGAGIGAYIIGNPLSVIKRTGRALGAAFKGSKYKKDDYLEPLSLRFLIFKIAKTKGMLGLKVHIENPEESELFAEFPGVSRRSSRGGVPV